MLGKGPYSPKIIVQGQSANKSKGIGFNSDIIELFLWLLLLSFMLYIYLPDIFESFIGSSESLNKTQATKSRSTIQKVPEYRLNLTMQVVITNGDDDVVKNLADSLKSKQLIIPEAFRKSEQHGSVTKIDKRNGRKTESSRLGPSDQDNNIKSCQIKCTAPFPIEFVYEGNGLPTYGKIILENRKVQFLENVLETFFIATLDFEKNRLVETDTGRYVCQSVREATPQLSKTLKILNMNNTLQIRAAIEIFVPGEMKIINRNIFYRKEYKSAVLVRNLSEVSIYHDIAFDGEEIIIPCGVSDPKTQVSLYLKEELVEFVGPVPVGNLVDYNSGKEYFSLEGESNGEHISYDTVDGFQIPVALVKDWSEINFICKTHQGEIYREIPFKVKLKGVDSQVSPTSSQVTLHPDQLPIQVFRCEAMEPLTVKWLNGPPTHVAHGVSTVNSKMYSASFIATPTQFSGDSPVAKFECLRKRDGMVIHTWEWIKAEVTSKPQLTYNGERKELSCCTRNAASYLFVERCSTMLDCQVKASLQSQIASSGWSSSNKEDRTGQIRKPKSSNDNNNRGCAVWTLPSELQAGLIMCTEVRNNSHSDHFRNTELPPVFLRWKNDVVFIRNGLCSKSVDHLISMQFTTNIMGEGYSGNYRKIECIASSMLFTKGFRWKILTVDDKVFEDVQLKSNWHNSAVISYREEYQSQTASYYGVLHVKSEGFKKPLLKINSEEDGITRLELQNKIAKITCAASLWNDTNIWIETSVNKSVLN